VISGSASSIFAIPKSSTLTADAPEGPAVTMMFAGFPMDDPAAMRSVER
jgi:hypothetical protein